MIGIIGKLMVHLAVRPAVEIVMAHDNKSFVICMGDDVGLREHDKSIARVRTSSTNRPLIARKPNHSMLVSNELL